MGPRPLISRNAASSRRLPLSVLAQMPYLSDMNTSSSVNDLITNILTSAGRVFRSVGFSVVRSCASSVLSGVSALFLRRLRFAGLSLRRSGTCGASSVAAGNADGVRGGAGAGVATGSELAATALAAGVEGARGNAGAGLRATVGRAERDPAGLPVGAGVVTCATVTGRARVTDGA